jgi:hypothetical protein
MITPDGGFRHRQVTVRDAHVHVVEAGDPDARPFVFLQAGPSRRGHGSRS